MPSHPLYFTKSIGFMLKISTYNKDRVQLQADLKRYETNEYLTSSKNRSTKSDYSLQFFYIKNKFFYWESEQKASLLNTWSNLFSTISDIYADYVWQPVRWQEANIANMVKDYVSLWFAAFCLERINQELRIVYVPAKGYFRENWVDRIARFYEWEEGISDDYYILLQSFYDGYIENKLYKTLTFDVLNLDVEVTLDAIAETANLQPIVYTGIEWQSLFVVKEDEREQNPVSIFQKIQHLVLAIDRNIVMFNTQFLQNTESYTLFKGVTLPSALYEQYDKGIKVDMSKLWRNVMWEEDSSIEFINNKNQLIEKAMQYEEVMVRRVAGATSIPQEFLWLEQKNSAIWKGSRLLSHWSFIKKIEHIRSIFDKVFREVEKIMMKENGDMQQYYRPDVFAKTDLDLLEEIEKKLTLWLLTKQRAIMSLEGLNEDSALKMIKSIKQEMQTNENVFVNNIKN